MYHTYILKSLKHGRYYYGSSHDVQQRLKAHNAGEVKSTRNGRPWILQYSEEFETKASAQSRERYFKKRSGYGWLKEQEII